MSAIRAPAVAGMFYPGSSQALSSVVAGYLQLSGRVSGPPPKAIVVPHAGYIYSGAVAGAAYALLAAARGVVRRVVILGPAHRVALRGLALPAAGVFATPLGSLEVDTEAVAQVAALPGVTVSDAAHELEHSLEVQLPFLQMSLSDFRIVPLAVGTATAESVAAVLDVLWGGPETLIVLSSDLSHYHRYADAEVIDRGTVEMLLALDPALDHEQACGATPLNGFLLCARRRRMAPELLRLSNSGDTAGDRSRVVGYAALAYAETAPARGASTPGNAQRG